MMDKLIERFPAQLAESLAIGEAATITAPEKTINKIYVAGLGGSGIGGEFVAEMVADECKVPYLIGKGYGIPAYVDENTLAIISSYSGNTEETIEAFHKAKAKNAEIACVSSGGQLIELAKENNLNYIQLPSGDSPRAMMGYSITQLLYVLNLKNFTDQINIF